MNYFYNDLIKDAEKKFFECRDIVSLNLIRSKFLGKNGLLKLKINNLKSVSLHDRSKMGFIFNNVKRKIQNLFLVRKKELEKIRLDKALEEKTIDVSLPGRKVESGSLHPITKTIIFVEKFFSSLGFSIKYGPEIENCYYNFNSLNTYKNHPAYSLNDTFWIDKFFLLRTQTSSIQVRVMKENKPPIHIITYGRVYRKDYDKNHTPMFHQLDCLSIDKDLNFSNLKFLVFSFLNYFFGKKVSIRFRPSYFPFTEPSAEVDIIMKNGKYLEILGCGMVHPNILKNVGINSSLYSGFALGLGIERLAMLRYELKDLRVFFKNDIRFLKQFI